jgi:hypothetical protein
MHMICTSLSLAALGLGSLAGCEVENPSHLKTEAETIQVPSLSEHVFRPSVVVSVSFCDTLANSVAKSLAVFMYNG